MAFACESGCIAASRRERWTNVTKYYSVFDPFLPLYSVYDDKFNIERLLYIYLPYLIVCWRFMPLDLMKINRYSCCVTLALVMTGAGHSGKRKASTSGYK
ncbi:hypothetical protein ACT691_08430 [Vibrio metschnikovii]